MIQRLSTMTQLSDPFVGVRMTAEEFFDVTDDDRWYELVDGVVLMSPSPTPQHQQVCVEITSQIAFFLRRNKIGKLLYETDVQIGKGPSGGDLVYRPEIVFYRRGRTKGMRKRLKGPPDLVVEVISPDSRRFDSLTKKEDYERLGVQEYWLIDPERESMTFYRRQADRFVEASAEGDSFASQVVPGFVLDLARVREAWHWDEDEA